MNILAHAYLSGHHPELIIGNFIGDIVKGDPTASRHHLTPGVVAGVRLHRAIDTFTDAHPDVAAVRDLLHPRCHKYAGAAVDVFFDHFLAVDFLPLTGESLAAFVAQFYQTLRTHQTQLPASAVRMADYMIRQDWLSSYQFIDGIDQSLKGIARRTAYASGLDTAVADLIQYYDRIVVHFGYFWAALITHIQQVRTDLLATL